jgi:hypothetical protein
MQYILFKKWLKEKYLYLLAILPIVLYFFYKLVTRKTVDPIIPSNTPAVNLQKQLSAVRVAAALEIGKAKGKEIAVKEEVQTIISQPVVTTEDKRKQLQDLADLINRTRR